MKGAAENKNSAFAAVVFFIAKIVIRKAIDNPREPTAPGIPALNIDVIGFIFELEKKISKLRGQIIEADL